MIEPDKLLKQDTDLELKVGLQKVSGEKIRLDISTSGGGPYSIRVRSRNYKKFSRRFFRDSRDVFETALMYQLDHNYLPYSPRLVWRIPLLKKWLRPLMTKIGHLAGRATGSSLFRGR